MILLHDGCTPSSINQTRDREELEIGSSNWMRDLLRVSLVLYLIFYSPLFFRIREREYRLPALGGECHPSFLLFVFAALSLSLSRSLSSFAVTAHATVHPSNSSTLSFVLSYLVLLPSSFLSYSFASFSLPMAWTPSLSLFVPLAVSISLRRVSSMVDCVLPPLLF